MRIGADAFPILAVAAAIGIALGYGLATLGTEAPREPGSEAAAPDRVAPAPAPEDLNSFEFIALQRELEAERGARERLALELAALQRRLESDVGDPVPTDQEVQGLAVDASGSSPVTTGPAGPARKRGKQKPEQLWFDRTALEGADYSSSEIEEIMQRFEEFEMQKLYLENQSKRDGTFRSAGYNRKLFNLGRELRDDLGTGGYDAYLYATGKNNRVEVREVLADSPASYAGLEPGDIVISYSGLRVFHPREFKSATTTGESGARVTLEVLRDGELYRLSVARGPLGIRMAPVKRPPLSRW